MPYARCSPATFDPLLWAIGCVFRRIYINILCVEAYTKVTFTDHRRFGNALYGLSACRLHQITDRLA
eukprot:6014075-Pyramimonas_sp.AAC.1